MIGKWRDISRCRPRLWKDVKVQLMGLRAVLEQPSPGSKDEAPQSHHPLSGRSVGGERRALGTEIQSCEPLCGGHRESWWHPRSGYRGRDKREVRGCLRGWDFRFPQDFWYLCHLLPSASLPWSHPALRMYCWLAHPAWNSSRPTRSRSRAWEPGSVLHKFARVIDTTWVLVGFLNYVFFPVSCFLRRFTFCVFDLFNYGGR